MIYQLMDINSIQSEGDEWNVTDTHQHAREQQKRKEEERKEKKKRTTFWKEEVSCPDAV